MLGCNGSLDYKSCGEGWANSPCNAQRMYDFVQSFQAALKDSKDHVHVISFARDCLKRAGEQGAISWHMMEAVIDAVYLPHGGSHNSVNPAEGMRSSEGWVKEDGQGSGEEELWVDEEEPGHAQAPTPPLSMTASVATRQQAAALMHLLAESLSFRELVTIFGERLHRFRITDSGSPACFLGFDFPPLWIIEFAYSSPLLLAAIDVMSNKVRASITRMRPRDARSLYKLKEALELRFECVERCLEWYLREGKNLSSIEISPRTEDGHEDGKADNRDDVRRRTTEECILSAVNIMTRSLLDFVNQMAKACKSKILTSANEKEGASHALEFSVVSLGALLLRHRQHVAEKEWHTDLTLAKAWTCFIHNVNEMVKMSNVNIAEIKLKREQKEEANRIVGKTLEFDEKENHKGQACLSSSAISRQARESLDLTGLSTLVYYLEEHQISGKDHAETPALDKEPLAGPELTWKQRKAWLVPMCSLLLARGPCHKSLRKVGMKMFCYFIKQFSMSGSKEKIKATNEGLEFRDVGSKFALAVALALYRYEEEEAYPKDGAASFAAGQMGDDVKNATDVVKKVSEMYVQLPEQFIASFFWDYLTSRTTQRTQQTSHTERKMDVETAPVQEAHHLALKFILLKLLKSVIKCKWPTDMACRSKANMKGLEQRKFISETLEIVGFFIECAVKHLTSQSPLGVYQSCDLIAYALALRCDAHTEACRSLVTHAQNTTSFHNAC